MKLEAFLEIKGLGDIGEPALYKNYYIYHSSSDPRSLLIIILQYHVCMLKFGKEFLIVLRNRLKHDIHHMALLTWHVATYHF